MNIFTDSWAQSAGITLLHSLWQSLAVLCFINVVLWAFKIYKPAFRYTLYVAGLFVFVMAVVTTFLYSLGWFTIAPPVSTLDLSFGAQPLSIDQTSLGHWYNIYLPWIITGWLFGILLFTLRLVGGFVYLQRIKHKAQDNSDAFWTDKIHFLKRQLKMTRAVGLKISRHIKTPMVMGVFKPAIFLPITLMSGLSDEQIDTIICHELAHIKRHDFIINIFQHVIEIFLFFNPFVWILSDLIRREREHACDDLALSAGGNTVAYAKALLQLQEIQRKPQLALYFANNNNTLISRIKRLTGMKTQKFLEARVIALVILAMALMSFGWYSFQQQKDSAKSAEKVKQVHNADAAPMIKKVSLHPEKAQISDVPPVDVLSDTVPAVEPPPPPPVPDWDKAFTEKFKAQFGDFYIQNQEALEKMMEEARAEQIARTAALDHYMQLHQKDMSRAQLSKAKRQLAMEQAERERHRQLGALERQQHRKARQQEMMAREMQLGQERLQKQALELQEKNKAMQKEMQVREKELIIEHQRLKKLEEDMRMFQEEITKELIKDGYLKSGDEIKSLNFNTDNYEINGRKIKKKDAAKYEKLYKKHFGENPNGFRIEH